jgi:hypothetical protein
MQHWSVLPALLATTVSILFTAAGHCERFSGEIQSIVEDHADGHGATEQFRISDGADGPLIEGVPHSELSPLVGRRVVLEGTRIDRFHLRADRIVSLAPRTATVMAPEGSQMTILVGIFDLRSNRAGEMTPAEIRTILIDEPNRSVKKLLEINSYGNVSIASTQVATRVSLDIDLPSSGSCYPWYAGTFLPAARSAFAAQGIDHASFDRVMYILPNLVGSTCGFAGVAISSRDTLYAGGLNTTLVLHELGHNQWPITGSGFGHASSDLNNDGTIDSAYGDDLDAMGISGYWYNFGHAEKGEWWARAGGRTRTISEPGSVTLELPSAEFAPGSVSLEQRIRINVPGDSRPYFLTYRRMVGNVDSVYYDAFVDERLTLHRPALAATNTLLIRAMLEGESVSPAGSNLFIEFLGQNRATRSSRVRVTIGAVDSDGDGMANDVDNDDDNDGIIDTQDCAPTMSDRSTLTAWLDVDNDGWTTGAAPVQAHICVGSAPDTGYRLTRSERSDNCPFVVNPGQEDNDRDGNGNACDPTPGEPAVPEPLPPGAPPSTPPGAGTPVPGAPQITITDRRVDQRKRLLLLNARATLASDQPSAMCHLKAPRKTEYAAKNYAKTTATAAGITSFSCRVPIKKIGASQVRVRSCSSSAVCSEQIFTIHRRGT